MNLQEWLGTEEEKPLDRMVTDGGLCGILRSIGCIGDSLSSGEFETYDDDGKKVYLDRYEYSWGQFIARAAGVKVHNFSRGGMTAKAYCDYFAEEKGFWSKDLACNAYILALGANDCHQIALGSVADTAILMMQDLIGLGSEARINTPSTLGGNWQWRVADGCANDWLAGIIRENVALYGRLPKSTPDLEEE